MAISVERIHEIGSVLEKVLPEGLECHAKEDGIRVVEAGGDRILGASVWLTADKVGEGGEPFNAIGFYGESSEDNGYSPAVVSYIADSEYDARSALRLAVACAFNKEIPIDFLSMEPAAEDDKD